jgi:beta-mannosidase
MVWQDFMFACSEYPQSAAFLRSVKREAEAAVRRLRQHASVVIWCGNNECQMMHAKTCDARFKGSRIYYDLLPPICEDLDGTRPYWPGSPWAGPHPNAETHGDQHYWNVWHGAGDPEYYLGSQCRFVSEFGMQAMPCAETLRESIPAEELYDGSPSMNSHNKGGMGPGKLARYTTTVLPTPKSIDEFAWFSQLMQARAIRIGVEHWRRMKWRNAGALIWQLNDCWPVASWAMIDGADRPKALLYASKRFFDPVLVSANRYGRTIEVGVTNDTDLEIKGKVICRVTDVATGKVAREQAFDVTVKPNSAKKVCAKAPDELGFTDLEGQFLWLEWVSGKRIVAMNHYDPAPYRYMPLRDAKLKTDIRKGDGGGVDITLETPTTARGVTLSLGNDVVGHFKDNYLDLYPNRPVTVRLETEATVKAVKEALEVKHLLMER